MALQAEEIGAAFAACGIGPGGMVMLHCDAIVAAQIPAANRFDLLFDAIEAALAPGGTLIVPTFTYSFTRGEAYDPQHSPSTVGLLTEHFRQRAGVQRSGDPLFSVAASGAEAADIARAATDDCFGTDSVFDLLWRRDGWIACLGCGFDRITFTHYAEQRLGVAYRYFKIFTGMIRDGDRLTEASSRYFVRDLDRDTATDLARLKRRLRDTGVLAMAPVGRVGLLAVRARDFLIAAEALLREDPAALIREGAR